MKKYFFALMAAFIMTPAVAGESGLEGTLKVYGQTMGNWGHGWWQWALNFPTATNPILQDGHVDCSAGQSGKVWYLAGTFGEPAERTCTIKEGKALYIPLLNGIYWTPEDCKDVKSCRTGVATNIDAIENWTCTVDGIPCAWFTQVVRAQSDSRPLNLPAGSIAVTDFGYAPGVRKISIADQYAVMLKPLRRGKHHIHYTSRYPGFELDVTYHLTVMSSHDHDHEHDHD